VFLEAPRTATWRNDIELLLAETKAPTDVADWLGPRFGLKLRCGGVSADAFPTDEDVAFFIARCRDAGLPWKATAGLHHPRRHFDKSLSLWHNGFLNVFVAGLLAQSNPLTPADIAAILADRHGTHFCFKDDRIAWKDWSCTTEQINASRRMATSFGSCSFEEPVEDLIALGLLDRA
jgi:hypothetical protein